MAELFFKVAGPVVLSEGETAELIRRSDGRALSCSFGSRVCLSLDQSAWALPILAEMRGLNADPANGGLIIWGASESP